MNFRNSYTRLGLVPIFLLAFLLLIFSPEISQANDAPPDTIVEFGDVVNLNYTLWVDNIIISWG